MSRTSKAIDRIQSMISSGEFRPGDRLPAEGELADRLGLSRGTLREAVRALSHTHVLDVRRGDGTYVTSLSPNELLSGLGVAIGLLRSEDQDEVMETRRLLLPAAMTLAARRVTAETIAELRAVLDQVDAATDGEEVGDLADRVSCLLAKATGNETLGEIMLAIHRRGDRDIRVAIGSRPDLKQATLTRYRGLVDALEQGDEDLARLIMTVLIDERQRWAESLNAVEPS